jgi:hypothetical protein
MTEARPQLGFTGTRHGMTAAQRAAVVELLDELAPATGFVAHHGDCVGADAEFHDLCRERPSSFIVIHPGPITDLEHQAHRVGDERREPLPHMRRNKNIVLASDVIIATPFEDLEQEYGGTWRTIGMARKAKRQLAIVWRHGRIIREGADR